MASNRIIWTIGFVIIGTTMHAQSIDGKLNRIWELNSVEHLSGMGHLGDEMKRLDMTNNTQLVFEGGGQSGALSYKVIDGELRLFDNEGNQLGQDIIWKIETLTADELSLLLIAREDNEKLARLNYRVKG